MKHFFSQKNNIIILASVLFVVGVFATVLSHPRVISYLNMSPSAVLAGPGGSGKSSTSVTCTSPATYPAQPASVNKQVLWQVTVASTDHPVNSLWYTPVFDGVAGQSVKIKTESFEVSKIYNTVGKKRFKVVVDQGGTTLAECAEAEVVVKVAPRVNNR